MTDLQQFNWRQLDEAHSRFIVAKNDYLRLREDMKKHLDISSILKSGAPGLPREIALEKLKISRDSEKKKVFPDLVVLASSNHGFTEACRELICDLPRAWVLKHIGEVVEPILANGGYEEYSAIIGMYSLLQPDLAKNLALRASRSSVVEIKEVGEDFLKKTDF